MTPDQSKCALNDYQKQCVNIYETAKTAIRNKQSLTGSNFYGNKFNNELIILARAEINLRKVIEASQIDELSKTKLFGHVAFLKSPTTAMAQRTEALNSLRLIFQSTLIPQIESLSADPVPVTEQVLPASVVHKTRGYFEKLIAQANGCYEHQWYDACSVMIRRFTETAILEVYESQGRADEIKDNNNEFLSLRDLIGVLSSDTVINLGRETKKTLPLLKELGDRSAHNRRYVATRPDIDKVIPGFRLVADELLHLAGLK